jgi:hypothetical protein
MTLKEKFHLHSALADAYSEGFKAAEEARKTAMMEAMQAVAGLTEIPGTCCNPGDKLSKAATARNTMVNRAVCQIDQLRYANGYGQAPGDLDDDVPF